LIYTGYKLAHVGLFTDYYKRGMDQFLPFAITILVMLVTDLLKGVSAGIIVAVVFIIRNNIKTSFETIQDLIDGRVHYFVKLPTHLTFFNKGKLINFLDSVRPDSVIIIDGSINRSTDTEIKEVLKDFIDTSTEKNIDVQLLKYEI
jgi:MFS superfamily sulfate permease-like transporter